MRRARLLGELLFVAALATILVFVHRSLGRAVVDGGPLGPQENVATACLPGRPGNANTDGLENYVNSGRGTVIIDRLSLAQARGLKLAGAYIVPGRYSVGTWATFPPPAGQLPRGVEWAQRRSPGGTRVPPGRHINVVAGIEPTGDATGSTAGIVVWYHDGNTHYQRRSMVRVVIKVSPARCF
jgi:hypothetical protein